MSTDLGHVDARPALAWQVEPLAGERAAVALVAEDLPGHAPLSPDTTFDSWLEERLLARGRRAAERTVAVDFHEYRYTVADLLDRAGQLAGLLALHGVHPGQVVGVLLPRSLDLYAVQLAVSRLGATYLPLDPGLPPERMRFMLEDSAARLVLAPRADVPGEGARGVEVLALDDEPDRGRLPVPERPAPDLAGPAYLVYTSGTTGRPKGVVVTHANIVNFLRVASATYGYLPTDRVYQGLSPAFDFVVEETWVPLASGARLVPAPADTTLVGPELADFLVDRGVTALCCVPTLLATLPGALPQVRFLLVSGEDCPRDVIEPWLDGRRRVLNAYGPTETTVTATIAELQPGGAVTLGGPLPTYSVAIAAVGACEALPAGHHGEVVVAGPGVAAGYLGRAAETAAAFVPDFAGLTAGGSGTLYRTGDLGVIGDDGSLRFLGRIDTQVKIRGYRIELAEIEALVRSVPGVGQAVVHPYTPPAGEACLVAYLVARDPASPVDVASVDSALRDALPGYMVPTHYEVLASLPMLGSTKVDRAALPEPASARWSRSTARHVAASTPTEVGLAELLSSVLGLDTVSAEADFFDDLGANSLSMASYAAEIRRALGIRRVSMKLLYQNSTVRLLATRVDELATTAPRAAAPTVPAVPAAPAPEPVTHGVPAGVAAPAAPGAVAPDAGVSRLRHVGFGAAQAAVLVTSLYVAIAALVAAERWVLGGTDLLDTYLRSVAAGLALFLGGSATLLGVRWVAVGRGHAEDIELWSTAHLRFWAARLAVLGNPLVVFRGAPLYNVYLRLLGARVGRGAVVLAAPPACPDLVSIGADTVVRRSARFPGYAATGRRIRRGPVHIGDRCVVGEATYLDIGTTMEDGAVLGTTSALLEGQVVPAGRTYQGSPAEPAEGGYLRVEPHVLTTARRVTYTAGSLASLALVALPGTLFLGAAGVAVLPDDVLPTIGSGGVWASAVWLALASAATYFGGLVTALVAVTLVPRVLHRFVRTGESHPLYGTQHALAEGIAAVSNSTLLNTIFGDSSMILGYLRLVGYDLRASTQTGSNFGVDQQHHNPFLCAFDRNTLVSDGLRMLNTETSATSFVTRRVTVPPDTYLGNDVYFPSDASVGPNCLIATKAAIPVDGRVRSDVGILGSPPFEIPRTVRRDQQFDHYKRPGVIEGRLRLKLRSNLVTLGWYLLRSWLLTAVAMGLTLGAVALTAAPGAGGSAGTLALAGALTAAGVGTTLAGALLSILFERTATGFRPLEPRICSLYERAFWDHERFWKLNYNAFLRVFDGTPMKPALLRLQGARVGRQVFDDGAGLTEPSMVSIGDFCTLGAAAAIQSHSLEDGTFKSDRILLEDGCTVGSTALVHYGAHLHRGVVVAPDAFVMKGSEIEAGATWAGNPARAVDADRADETQ